MVIFSKRKKHNEVHAFIRRVTDNTCPTLSPLDGEARWEGRWNRTIPVLLAPFEDEDVVVDDTAHALTKNLSSQGAALVLHQPFRTELVVVGFLIDDSQGFVLGEVKQNVPIGGGFWQLGIEFRKMIVPGDYPGLKQLDSALGRLNPPKQVTV